MSLDLVVEFELISPFISNMPWMLAWSLTENNCKPVHRTQINKPLKNILIKLNFCELTHFPTLSSEAVSLKVSITSALVTAVTGV